MTLENDILKMLGDKIDFQTVLIDRYMRQQLLEARRTPGITKLNTFNLLNPVKPAPTALQIVPKNDSRESVAITNAAGDDCLIAEQWFDPTTILGYFQDLALGVGSLAYNASVPIGFLAAGGSVSLEGTTGIWAYGLGSNLGVPAPTLLSIADSVYVTKEPSLKDKIDMQASELHPSERPGGGSLN